MAADLIPSLVQQVQDSADNVQSSQEQPAEEEEEGLQVSPAYTVVQEEAVVVHVHDAFATLPALRSMHWLWVVLLTASVTAK